MMIADKLLIGAAAGAFTLLVLAVPGLVGSPQPGSGTRTIAQATRAELDIIRSGPITVAQYNTVTGWQADCLRKAGASPQPIQHRDGRVDYGASISGQGATGSDTTVERCFELGMAVRATYLYDHLSFLSWSTPLPGLGSAVRQLRSGEPSS